MRLCCVLSALKCLSNKPNHAKEIRTLNTCVWMWVILKALVSGELHPLPPLLSFWSSTPGNEACCLPVTWRCFPLWYSLLSTHTLTHMHTHSEGEVNAVKRRIRGISAALFVFYSPKTWEMRLCESARLCEFACVQMPASWQGVKAQTYVNQMLWWWQSRRREERRESTRGRNEWRKEKMRF